MDRIKEVLGYQYQLVRDARQVLLDYCVEIDNDDFIRSSPDVGNGGSIRNLMVHVGNTYVGWLSQVALQRPINKIAEETVPDLTGCIDYYSKVDQLVEEFLDHFDNHYNEPVTAMVSGVSLTVTPLKLFTHVTTHEFHHKGQMLTLSRMWGHIPVDTDVLRT